MTTEVEYQVVTSAPVEEIVALYQAGGWWQESPANRSRIEPMIRGSFCFMVARPPNGQIVAMGRVISDGASDAYIQDVVVLPPYRRQGVGGELIRRLTQYCIEHKIGWIGLLAEPGTPAFYEKLGYGVLRGYQAMLYGKRG
jgi:ribosomal protein S18 acetylase RimI-like enzyme